MGRRCELVKVRILALDVERRLQIKVGRVIAPISSAVVALFFHVSVLVYLIIFKTEKMKKITFLLSLGLSHLTFAQNYVHQVYVLNEGYFDYQTNTILEPVTLGSYNPQTDVYSVVDTIENMRFGSDIFINGDFAYIAADSKILKYNKLTNQLVGSIDCPGVRNVVVENNYLVATRGEYLTTYDSYLHIYDANSLQLVQAIDTINGPKWAAQNMVVNGSIVYVAINNGYEWGNEKGLIGQLNLNDLTYGNEIDLGPEGKNPDNMMLSGSTILTVNNKDWTGASVSKLDITTNNVATSNIASSITGCGTSCLRADNIIYQISGESVLNEWNVLNMSPVGPVVNHNLNYYEIAEDQINGLLYASNTDFFSFGKVYIFDVNNNMINSFDVGVSPGTIAFDTRSAVGLDEGNLSLQLFPNPTNGKVQIEGISDAEVLVYAITGEVRMSLDVVNASSIDLSALPEGSYFINVKQNEISSTVKVVLTK